MEEKYIVSARKYRPSTFSSVVGQKALTATLRNAIQTDRLAHAYLFCGSRGVGKTTCARIFAKTINCAHPTPEGDPCNECPSCRDFNENRSINIMELDAASNNSVEDIRDLNREVLIPPTEGRYRVFIIDEVHMLTQSAFNAFLKTLEEPPAHAIFILATTEKHKIIPTILSRCQIYDFKRITITDIIDHLEYVAKSEGIQAERQALGVIARKADGAMRDALSIFDQVAASSRGNITYQSAIDNLNMLDERCYGRLVEAFRTGDVPSALIIYKEILDRGFDSYFFLGGLAGYLRDLMMAGNPQTVQLLDADPESIEAMKQQASQLPPQFFYAAMSLCNDADMDYRTAASKTFLIELLLIKLCQLQSPSPASDGAQGEGHQLKPITPAAPATQPVPASPAPPQASQPGSVAPTSAAQPSYSAVPNAQEPAAPAYAASPSPARRPAVRRPAMQAGGVHVSLRGALADAPAAATAAAAPEQQAPKRNNPFTDDALAKTWDAYMQLHSKAHVLCNTMRASRPTRVGGADSPRLHMLVANQPQVDIMTQELPALLSYLRDNLGNDHIDIDVAVAEDPNSPAAWSDRDVLRHIIETNPAASDFITLLDLTIS